MAKTLADPAKRTAHVQDIVATVVNNGYDGIDLDYEVFAFSDGSASWATTQPNWTAFVTELGAALRGQGKKLIVTIPGPCSTTNKCGGKNGYWVYDMAGIAPAVDRIRIMAYDFHVNGAGPIAPISWVTAIVQYSITVMDPAKLQIGVLWPQLDEEEGEWHLSAQRKLPDLFAGFQGLQRIDLEGRRE
jgi:spore germination protein YaaH